jgi:hypothetical protein
MNNSNIILLTVDNNHVKNTRDADDLVELLSKDPYDLKLIEAFITGKIIHIVSDNFNEVALPTHIYAIVPENSPHIPKLNKIKGDEKLCGALQIWLQIEAFRSRGIFANSTREFVIALVAFNQMEGAFKICIDKKPKSFNELIGAVLNPSWQ